MLIKVKDQYRKNELSLTLGGSEVTAILENGKSIVYDKIKSISRYCNKLKNDHRVIEILVNGEVYWKRN